MNETKENIYDFLPGEERFVATAKSIVVLKLPYSKRGKGDDMTGLTNGTLSPTHNTYTVAEQEMPCGEMTKASKDNEER